MSRTLALIERAHEGDKKARDTVFKENVGLIYSVIRRFAGRGVEMEDLFQIGSIGLLKAIDKFDLSFEVQFSTYAVPMIMGEIKRFLRDDGMIKISRSLKETGYRIKKAKEELELETGREPTIMEIAKKMNITVEEIAEAVEAGADVESLQKILYQGDGTEILLGDKISEKKNIQEKLVDQIFLENILMELDEKEKRLLNMRYFKDMTQMEIAKKLGISQVQVSRMEKKILEHLRKKLR